MYGGGRRVSQDISEVLISVAPIGHLFDMVINPGLPGSHTQVGLNVNSSETAVWIYVKVHAHVPVPSPWSTSKSVQNVFFFIPSWENYESPWKIQDGGEQT